MLVLATAYGRIKPIMEDFDTRLYVQDGVVYGAAKGNSPNSEVVALDAETGQVIWQYVAENTLEYSENFLVTDNYVFAKGSGYIFALDKSTGERKWGFVLDGQVLLQ